LDYVKAEGISLHPTEAALQVSPEHLPAIQGAALVAVRSGRDELRLAAWLEVIALRSGASWQTWAQSRR
jgi:hypothetical protein